MPLHKSVIKDVADLSTDERFNNVWKHFAKEAEYMRLTIFSPETDVATREIMVRVYDIFKREVVDLPERALKEMQNQNQPDKSDDPGKE